MHGLMSDELFTSPPGDSDASFTVEDLAPDEASPQQTGTDVAVPHEQPEEATYMPNETPATPHHSEPVEEPTSRSREVAIAQSAPVSQNLGESGLQQLVEKSFTTPEATKAAVASLIDGFDDKGLWLSSLVQPAQLTAELRQGSSDLTTLVLTQWVRQGETHKLKQLGDALLAEEPKWQTHERARIMAVLAGLLGILRPVLAQRLLAAAAPRMIDAADTSLMKDARQWVDAGSLLEGCVPEERVFWNRRLREPSADWQWDTAEARMALGHLARKRPPEDAELELFHNTVPGCWWDLWRDTEAAAAPATMAPARADDQPAVSSERSKGGFALGLVIGMAAAVAVGGWVLSSQPELREKLGWRETVHVVTPAAAAPAAPKPGEPVLVEEQVPAPPIRDSLRQLQALLKKPAPPAAQSASGKATGAVPEVVAASMVRGPGEASSPGSGVSRQEARKKALLEFARKQHPDVARLVKMVQEGSFRENAQLIQGASSVATMGSPMHRAMIQWLILEPPERADSRLVVTKVALRAIPAVEIIPLFDLCYYEGSPNELEIKECSQVLLELPIDDMKADHKARLQAIVGTP